MKYEVNFDGKIATVDLPEDISGWQVRLLKDFIDSALENIMREKPLFTIVRAEDAIERLGLQDRTKNCLSRNYYNNHYCQTIQDVIDLYSDGQLINVRNLGRKSYDEVVSKLVKFGFITEEKEGD